MLNNNIEEMLKTLTDDEISTIIKLASKEQKNRDETKERKYMTAILKAIQDYLNNVGVLIFHVEYDNIDGQGEVEVLVDNMNPPVGDQGAIFI